MKRVGLSLIFVSSSWAFTLGGSNSSDLQGWDTTELAFNVNYSGCSVSNAALDAAIDDAIGLWNSASNSGIKLARGATSTSTISMLRNGLATDSPVIACDTDFSNNIGVDGDFVVGVGNYSSSNSRIVYGYLVLNAESGAAGNIANLTATKLAIIVAHEIGHVLGLGHSGDSAALMYYDATAKTELRLAQDDVDGMAYLYPRSEFGRGILGCGALAPLASGRGGKGGPPAGFGQALFSALMILAGSYLLKRRLALLRVGGVSTQSARP